MNFTYDNVIEAEDLDSIASRRFLSGVFTWMFVALAISALTTYLFTTNATLLQLIVDPTTGGLSGLGYIAMFSPLVFAMVMQFGYNRLSYPILIALFISYATVIGISLSLVFLAYTAASVLGVFITSSLVFAVMAVAGYYTHQDLTKMGQILWIGMIGIVIGSFVNYFIGSSQFDYIISYVGVVVFVGLTAYYMQTLKRIGAGIEYGSASGKKLAIIGALVLYITLINLFLSLLRIFGRRR